MECPQVAQLIFFHAYWRKNAKLLACMSFLMFMFHPAFSAVNGRYPVKLTYGLYKQELDDPIYYNSFVPMIYEFNLPVWKNIDMTLRDWRGKCDTDEFSPSYSCPVFFHFEKFIERFKLDVLNNTLVMDTVPSAPVSLPEDFCNSIEQHFPGMLTGEDELEKYFDSLKKCQFGRSGLYARSLQDYLYNIKEIYKTMNQKFEQEFSNRMTSTDRIGPAYYINALSSHQNSLMFNFWVEKTRWDQAQISCNGKTIPNSVIRYANFTNDLVTIEKQVYLQNLTPSVAVNETSIYYKLPVADCSFVSNGNFLVRILIPVRKRSSKPKMYKVKSVPFIHVDGQNKQICQISMESERFLHNRMTGSLEKTDCTSRSLCQVRDSRESQLPDMCITSFFSESLTNIRKHCKFDCLDIDDHGPKIPIFIRVSSDTYIVTGNSIVGILVKCDDKPNILLENQYFGSLEVKLPCNCHLMFHSESYHVQQPCSNKLIINQVIPVHFIKEDRLYNITSVNSSIFISDTTMLEQDLTPDSARLHTLNFQSSNTSSSSTVIWVLFIIQTVILVALLAVGVYKYKLHRSDIFYSKERLVYNISSVSSPSMADTHRASSIEST